MDELGIYVVRVYRRDAAGLAGTVEAVASGERQTFRSNDDLWRALHDLLSVPWRANHSQPEEEERK